LELIRRENYTKEQLDVPAGYFEEFQNKNPRDCSHRLKHINLKEASDAIRQQFGEKQTATVSKAKLSENKKYWLIQTLYIYITTQFSVLQSI
jgi:DNA polymerase-3 subunit alpha